MSGNIEFTGLPADITYRGIPASPGISIGKAYLYERNNFNVDEHYVGNGEIEKELADFESAIKLSVKELSKIRNLAYEKIGEKNSSIFDVQLEILNDNFFIENVTEYIRKERRTAGYIFDREISKLGRALLNSDDDYLRERYADINDVRNRVIRNMKQEKLVSNVEEQSIIISHELTPADTILFSKRKVQGYAVDKGGVTSHAAIISRALRIPAVVGMKDISKEIKTSDFIIIDGFNGLIIKNPTDAVIKNYESKLKELKEYEGKLNEVIGLPNETLDGKKIEISANIEFDEEIDFVVNTGHCSIGLYRTEHLFLEAGDFPSEMRQFEEYKHIANSTYPNSVTIRTYDIGGDKILPRSDKEDNPFLGWRGIRICLDRPEIFKEQLSAILRASAHKNVKIMLPMISSVKEVIRSKEILKEARECLDAKGIHYDKKIQLGIMIEVPSAYFLADELAEEVDFFSIGTNDLTMYMLAADRGNQYISGLYSSFHPAVMRAIKNITDTAHTHKITVSICGEMASDPLATAVLVGMDIDELSIVPFVFPEIKQIVRKIKYSNAKKLANKLLHFSSEDEIRNEIKNFYKENLEPGFK